MSAYRDTGTTGVWSAAARSGLGLIARGDLPERLAGQLGEDLPRALAAGVCSDLAWEVPRVTDPLAADPRSDGTEMVDAARRRMLREGWDLAVCLTDVPLRIGRRPIVADASATHGVAVLSLPALEPCNCAAGHATPW